MPQAVNIDTMSPGLTGEQLAIRYLDIAKVFYLGADTFPLVEYFSMQDGVAVPLFSETTIVAGTHSGAQNQSVAGQITLSFRDTANKRAKEIWLSTIEGGPYRIPVVGGNFGALIASLVSFDADDLGPYIRSRGNRRYASVIGATSTFSNASENRILNP
jgi:hypothetical protein